MTIYRHEMRMNRKSLLIWALCVGGLCFGCILLYTSIEDSMKGIADLYSDMGAMSAALGMDKMSLATMRGYYATEIALMHGLGGCYVCVYYWNRNFIKRRNISHFRIFTYFASRQGKSDFSKIFGARE